MLQIFNPRHLRNPCQSAILTVEKPPLSRTYPKRKNLTLAPRNPMLTFLLRMKLHIWYTPDKT